MDRAVAAAQTRLTPEEYLAKERAAEQRHEYAGGEVFAMAGGTREHALIAVNFVSALHAALIERPCEVYNSEMRVKIPTTTRYVYPDAAVACGGPKFEDEVRDTLLNPLLIVEVLSDSTEAYDRGDKFAQYQTIPSLQEYVLASQKSPRVEIFRRLPDGTWLLRIAGPGARVSLESVQCEIAVDRAYLKVFTPAG